MKLLTDNKEDGKEWKLLETFGGVSIYEEVLPEEVVVPTSEKPDDYWYC